MSTEILTFLTWFLLVPTLAVYGVVRVSRSTPAERRAMQTLDAVRTAFELSLGEQYSTYEGVFEGHAMRVSLTPALQRPPSLLQPLHTLLVLLAIAFGIALLGIPGLDGLACAIATLATLLVLGVVTVGGLTRQFRASTVRVRAEVHVPRAEGVDIAHDIERPYLTGDPVFDDQFSAGGDRVATMALLGPEERRALVANAGLELRHNTVRRFLGDPTRAVDDVRAMAKVADALTSDLAPMPRLLRRIVSERGEAERLAAIDTLLHVRGPLGRSAVDTLHRMLRLPADPDAVAARLAEGGSVALASVGWLGHHGLPVHLPALQTVAATWPRHVATATAQIRSRVSDAAAGGLDVARPSAEGALSEARRGGELSER